ncbi:MAG TPA: YraN family protein [Vicinamibacterales bacterium]|nr:YraN family protein [Vicinamibacterales bacterium]
MNVALPSRMTRARQDFGLLGEDLACDALVERGYTIVARRYRTKSGELDIIARHRDYLVFVEVKARQSDSFGDPEEAVTLQKQQRMVWMAADYLARNVPHEVPCRFDVVAINTQTEPPVITVFEDAFRPGW